MSGIKLMSGTKLDDQQHYKELEESHDAKASERFHTPAYQSYSVEDYLKKMGVDIKEVTGDE